MICLFTIKSCQQLCVKSKKKQYKPHFIVEKEHIFQVSNNYEQDDQQSKFGNEQISYINVSVIGKFG